MPVCIAQLLNPERATDQMAHITNRDCLTPVNT